LSTSNNYTFKEICDISGYKASVVRYYEKEFKLNIPRDINGRRFFSKNDLDKLLYIKQLQGEGYNNSQIKKILENQVVVLSETAVTCDTVVSYPKDDNSMALLEQKLETINVVLNQLNENIIGKDKDILLSENMKLKMELKQKAYEIIELKEHLRYEKQKSKGFLARVFNRKR
jgi:DNA-binding transcriptional MerR regulator